MKKNKLGVIIAAVAAGIGAIIGIGALVKKGKNEDCNDGADCEVAYEEDYSEDTDSEE